jgi:methionyl-tRNA formyltransferase
MQRPGMNHLSSPVRVVFMGTPDFAVPTLRALLQNATPGRVWHAGLDLVGVVTQPDRPAGRGLQLAPSPVKRVAQEHGIPVMQPRSLRKPEAQAALAALAPDVIIVAAFGQILPPQVLDLPHFGCLNVHASLLPRHRGASPIAAAILAGDEHTGVSIMLMDEGLDTGPVLAQAVTPIAPDETAGQLFERLAELGAQTLVNTLPLWLAGGITPQPQDEHAATLTRPLSKEQGRLDWAQPADQVARHIRALTPWPGAYTTWEGHKIKILAAHPVSIPVGECPSGQCFTPDEHDSAPLCVATGHGTLALDVIQLEGRRALPVADVLRGHPALSSAVLGT